MQRKRKIVFCRHADGNPQNIREFYGKNPLLIEPSCVTLMAQISPRSSVDRAPASGAGSLRSNRSGGMGYIKNRS